MRIVADDNIPYVEHYFSHCGELILKPGRALSAQDLAQADMLLVRSVTRVDQALLKNSRVTFIGSAATGTDHLDTAWLDQADIRWSTAAGSNARAVVEYVMCVLAALDHMQLLPKRRWRIGVIGVGRIGSQVVENLRWLGCDVLQCDPLRAMHEKNFISTPLEKLAECDVLTLHTPLTQTGSYPTFHMLDQAFLQLLKKNTIIINAGRGAVIHFGDLKQYGQQVISCFDVWEGEPTIDLDALANTTLATPHIAGYSEQSRHRATEMLFKAACEYGLISSGNVPKVTFPQHVLSFANQQVNWRDVVLRVFDPQPLSNEMKTTLMAKPSDFDRLRKNFQGRFEFGWVQLQDIKLNEDDRILLKKWGFKIDKKSDLSFEYT